MVNSFQFVQEFGGAYIPFRQTDLRKCYEDTIKKPYTGSCVGMVAAILRAIIKPPASGFQQFKPPISPIQKLPPSPKDCVYLQEIYERDHENFFTIFTREELRISGTGFPNEDGHCSAVDLLHAIANSDSQTNRALLIRTTYELGNLQSKTVERQNHMLLFLKHNEMFLFCDPNGGIALFQSQHAFNSWLAKEMYEGSLKHFFSPVQTKMVIADTVGPSRVREGLLIAHSIYVEDYRYPVFKNNPTPPDRFKDPRSRSRL